MSSASGGGSRGRGRGNSHATPRNNLTPKSTSIPRPGRSNPDAQRGNRGTRGNAGRGGNTTKNNAPRTNGSQAQDAAMDSGGPKTQGDWQDRYQTLKQLRERERADAIRRGIMADPDKPRALADAITPVGTCQDMCPEFERVLRVVQNDVWKEETDPQHSAFARGEPKPDEGRMVKKFRRSAAGNDEQLPSDLRPPLALKRTCDYLFNDVIGTSSSLAKVHHFVWDRTRAIRNDFSIQQLTKLDDLRIAIECYERIARFHIVSLHLLALPEKPYDKYDAQQEREQLDRTLVSLVQYYDDCRGRFELVNEAEFRTYTVIFQLRDPTPDLEDRVQSWPDSITQSARVQKALEIYAAACNTFDGQGPLKPGTSHVIARQDWERFWQIVSSKAVSYLMACVAEIYFTAIRRMVLRALFRSASKKSAAAKASNSTSGLEWTIDELWDLFNFDDESELITFCERFGFSFRERDEDGQLCLDLSSVPGRNLPEPSVGIPIQSKSSLVEAKRHGRSIPAIIDGLTVRQAQVAGLITEHVGEVMSAEELPLPKSLEEEEEDIPQEDEDSLFVPETQKLDTGLFQSAASNQKFTAPSPKTSVFSNSSNFGNSSPFAPPTEKKPAFPGSQEAADKESSSSIFGIPSTGIKSEPKPATKSPFNFTNTSSEKPNAVTTDLKPAAKSPFNFLNMGNERSSSPTTGTTSPFSPAPAAKPPASPFSFVPGSTAEIPKASFTSSLPGQAKVEPTADSGEELKGGSKPSIFFSGHGSAGDGLLTSKADPVSMSATSASPFQLFPPSTGTLSKNVQFDNSSESTDPNSPSSDQQLKSPFTFGQPAAPAITPPNTGSQQGVPSKPSQPQSHSQPTNPATQATNASTPSTSTNANGQSLRRQSMNDWKPKTPSKLSNSFTVADDGSSHSPNKQAGFAPETGFATELAPNKRNTDSTVTPSTSKPPATVLPIASPPTFDSIVTRLAQELTFDPIAGFLKQYVDFVVGNVITKVQEDIYHERVNKEADDFRKFCLSYRYGQKWRDICRHHRLAKRGRERRQRAQRRLQQSNQMANGDGESILDDASFRGDSRAGSIAARPQSRRQEVDALFQSTLGPSRGMRDLQTTTGTKRPAFIHDYRNTQQGRDQAHKRLKSESAADERPSEASVQLSYQENEAMRASFLGYSLSSDAPMRASTTKSPYFRMKAVRTRFVADATAEHGVKRPRSESLDAHIHSRPSKVAMDSARSSLEPPPEILSRLSATQQPGATTSDEDEALFSRLQAAREALKDGADFMKSEVNKDEQLRTSTGSKSSNDSPSMALARAEARLRASRAESHMVNGLDVPAYRLRESRFVPRELYPRAVERAKEIRASRSRESSRPGSRHEEHLSDHFTSNQSPFATISAHPTQTSTNNGRISEISSGIHNNGAKLNEFASYDKSPFTSTTPTPFGFGLQAPHASAPESLSLHAPSILQNSERKTGISQKTFARQPGHDLPPSLATQTSEVPNGFTNLTSLPSWAQSDAETLTPKPADHTIQPSQVPKALSNSFGPAQSTILSPFVPTTQDSVTAAESNAYPPSQIALETASPLSDRDKTTMQFGSASDEQGFRPVNLSNEISQQEDSIFTSTDYQPDPYPAIAHSHRNPFGALLDEADAERVSEDEDAEDPIENQWDDQVEDHADVSEEDGIEQNGHVEYDEWEERPRNGFGHKHRYINEEEATYDLDGDIEDFDDEEEVDDEDDELESELEEDGDDADDGREADVGRYFLHPPPKLADMEETPGNTVDEPIELSD